MLYFLLDKSFPQLKIKESQWKKLTKKNMIGSKKKSVLPLRPPLFSTNLELF